MEFGAGAVTIRVSVLALYEVRINVMRASCRMVRNLWEG